MKKSILIVEDELIIAEEIKSILESYDYSILSIVTSGEEALEKAEKLKPDLVLMDIIIDGNLTGIEVANEIMTQLDIPVVYVTSHTDEKIILKAKGTNPYGYIVKPFVAMEFKPSIEMAISKHNYEKKLKESELKYRLIAENSIDIIWSLNKKMEKNYVSPSVYNILGYNEQEWYDLSFDKIFTKTSHKKYSKLINKIFNKAQEPNEHKLCFEAEIIHKKGLIIPVEIQATALTDNAGILIGVQGNISDITERIKSEKKQKELISKLHKAIDEIKSLKGIIPICASCKKIRDDSGYWHQVEEYVSKHTEAEFTHGLCPECTNQIYGKEPWFKAIDSEQ